ncbi:hypothetical protein ScPMuIL_006849 [Solemya velum]
MHYVSVSLLIISVFANGRSGKQLKVGAIHSWRRYYQSISYSVVASVSCVAIDDLIKSRVLEENSLRIVWRTANKASEGAGNAVDLFVNEKVDVIIGSPLSSVNTPIGHLSAHWNLPHISWLASDPKFENKNDFSTLIRTFGSLSKIGKAMVTLFKLNKWARVGIMTRTTGSCSYATDGVMNSFRKSGIKIAQMIETVTSNVPDSDIDQYLIQLSNNARIFIICYGDMRRLIIRACRLGMCNGEYFFIYPNLVASDNIKRPWFKNDSDDVIARKGYYYYYNMNIARWSSEEKKNNLQKFREEVPYRMAEPPFNSTYALDRNLTGGSYSPYLYDATYLYGLWVNHSITNNINVRDGRAMLKFTHNLTFDGMTGTVVFDGNGDIEPQYWVWDVTDDSGYPRIVALIDNTDGSAIHFWEEPRWFTHDGNPPKDEPICGFFDELCPEDTSSRDIAIIAACCGVVGFLALTAILLYILRKKHLEQEMSKMLWKVQFAQIDSLKGKQTLSTLKSLGSVKTMASASPSDELGGGMHTFINVGRYMGQVVAIKPITRTNIILTREDHLELKLLREMAHENIAMFVGACIEPPDACILYQYCYKGSLQDILENEEIKLDLVVPGISYIHSTSLKSHGRLKSSNCVIDNRWVLKITDYGLRGFNKVIPMKETDDFKSWLWTAPELLRLPVMPKNGTPEGDVYSYGIILHEIYYRMGPFPVEMCTIQEIVERVKLPVKKPFRPERVPGIMSVQEPMLALMELCWAENPRERMSFQQIKSYIRRHNHSETNIMDNMLKKLEKYACNLEELVEQRTSELFEEKKKTDQLLYRLLPSSVAEKLKCGDKVNPEVFDAVTIFFSDIVGFTSIAALSSPMEIVDLLNDLYTIRRRHYREVETIGDAYMVVSGLPKRNGASHAGEIANMALDLLVSIFNFKLRHLPERPVMIRAGIHSGSCCAGIVGLTMPRYCLFGDTVNTASRMESNGAAQRIHVSGYAKDALDKLGGYKLESRGEILVKGKGTMSTYWLLGRDGFDKPLPVAPDLS